MQTTTGTRLTKRPDGSESLFVRCVRLTVTRGPDKGKEILLDRQSARVGTGGECALQLTDPAVSRQHFELTACERGYLLVDLGSTNGTLVGDLEVERVLLTNSTVLTLGDTTLCVAPTDDEIEIPLSSRGNFGDLLGQSQRMRQVFGLLERLTTGRSTVLLEGESGTGKDVAAQAIHSESPRSDQPMIVIDCGAIPRQLIESELFGHEQGAFTGADQPRPGAIEEADGGTLFLDEVGDLPLELQPRLLRFLENQQVKRVGSAQHHRVDVRTIAATNRNLADEVKQGKFRQDLYYRLSVIRVEMPPLRDRSDDILLLAFFFAESFVRDPSTIITREIGALLEAYGWPGNVRELRNVVEQLAVVPEQALSTLRGRKAVVPAPTADQIAAVDPLADLPFHQARSSWQDRFERRYLTIQLDRAKGVVAHAAQRAGLPRQSFHRLLRKHRLRSK